MPLVEYVRLHLITFICLLNLSLLFSILQSPPFLLIYLSILIFLSFFSSRRVEAALALPAPQQQQPLLPSAMLPNPVQPNPCYQTLTLNQSPKLSFQFLILPNLSLHQPRKTPPRTPRLHPAPQQPPRQHPFQTGIHRPSRSQPGPQVVTTPGLRQRSDQRACQTK